jgi:hypothetical protein
MTPDRVLETATSLAKHLDYVRKGGETWTVLSKDEHGSGVTIGYGNARLHVGVHDGRFQVAGVGPDAGYSLRKMWRATFALEPDKRWPAWDTLRIAREVDRHIISAGYIDDVLVARARKDNDDAVATERMRWLSQVAGMFEVGVPSGEGSDGWKVFLRQFVKGSGYVESYGSSLANAGHLSINLSGIPAEVMLEMLAPLAAYAGRECKCCHIYGPGHHPALATVGCLRQKSERGEEASADRVARLVAGYGALPGSPQAALDEARHSEYHVSVVERDGQVLAVVEWDHDGCGEFTVELAKTEHQPGTGEFEGLRP